MASGANAMSNKRNVVLYLDKELVEKSRELGFNLSKTFENHLKLLINRFSTVNSVNNFNSTSKNSNWWAGPDLNRRPPARGTCSISFRSGRQIILRVHDTSTRGALARRRTKMLHNMLTELCYVVGNRQP
jgi:hypothetical protein